MMSIFGPKSLGLIRQQKAKSKLSEFKVGQNDYPNFNAGIDDLLFPSYYSLYKYCLLSFQGQKNRFMEEDLKAAYNYFESASRESNESYSINFYFFGSVASFLLGNFATSNVLLQKIPTNGEMPALQITIIKFLNTIFGKFRTFNPNKENNLEKLVSNYFNNVIDISSFNFEYKKYERYLSNDYDNFLYYYLLYSIVQIYENNCSFKLLPLYSKTTLEMWIPYLNEKGSIRMLWESQKMICEAGFLSGSDGVISLPTGTGKTKSIELIIQSAIIRKNILNALVVAPLKALCNEIKDDLKKHFKSAVVNSISDANIDDYTYVLNGNELKIVVVTPEKLSYIIHHQENFISEFQLLIFDEAHLLMEKGRGLGYELLLTHIKSHRDRNQQVVLMSAVVDNVQDIKNWFFSDSDAAIVDSRNLFTPDKAIGFYKPDTDRLLFYENYIPDNYLEDYFIPNYFSKILNKNFLTQKNIQSNKKMVTILSADFLAKNDPLVVFVPKVREFNGFLKSVLLYCGEENEDKELKRVNEFLKDNYGGDSILYKASLHGYYAHYGYCQNGVRILLEYCFKQRIIRKIVSTSTLAEGVNLPIKSIIIESTFNSKEPLSISTFRNLVGRAGRPDKYTDCNIISMELIGQKYPKYILSNYKKCFDKNIPVLCLSVLDPVEVKRFILNSGFSESLIHRIEVRINESNTYDELLSNESFIKTCCSICKAMLQDSHYGKMVEELYSFISLETITDNYLKPSSFSQFLDTIELTYSYSQCQNDETKTLLKAIFAIVYVNFSQLEQKVKQVFYATPSSDQYIKTILDWADKTTFDNNLVKVIKEEITSIFYNNFVINIKRKSGKHILTISEEEFELILKMWVSGASISKIKEQFGEKTYFNSVFVIESFIKRTFDYNLPYFISSTIEVIKSLNNELNHFADENYNAMNLCIDTLEDFLQCCKIGLPNRLACDFYKNIFQDRLMCMKLLGMLSNTNVDYDIAMDAIIKAKDFVLKSFDDSPRFFLYKLKEIIE